MSEYEQNHGMKDSSVRDGMLLMRLARAFQLAEITKPKREGQPLSPKRSFRRRANVNEPVVMTVFPETEVEISSLWRITPSPDVCKAVTISCRKALKRLA
jgi:hypothetical protein